MLGRRDIMRRTEPGLAPWTPFRELDDLRNVMSAALEDFFTGTASELQPRAWAPAVDVEERDKDYLFSVEAPGLDKSDVKVELQNGNLVISGERKEEKDEKRKGYLRHEQYYGAFRRSFPLPEDAVSEGLKATYKNGILKVSVPRSEKSKGKNVQINVE